MTPDLSVRDFTVSRPRLRRDLRFTYQDYRGRPSYILEDLTHRRYFQIGLAEYQFLRGMDGHATAQELLAKNARDLGDRAISQEDASVLLRWLVDEKLLEALSADQSDRRYRQSIATATKRPKPVLQKLFFLPVPLGNPDAFLARVLPWLRWSLGVPFLLIWSGVLAYAAVLLADFWRPFAHATSSAILPENWLFLGCVYVGLKLIHELWHGIVSKHYGAVVPEWGLQLLVFFTPLTYVDASGSWRFHNRWHRIHVAAAGMFIELFLAALAVMVWVRTQPGFLNSIAYNTIFAASTTTILFNANPLMRFDGYYILSDLIRIPNLATKGQQFMNWFWRKLLFGAADRPPPAFVAHPWAVGLYGFLSFCWRWVVWAGIMVTVALLFKGVGVVFAVLSMAGMVGSGLYGTAKYLFKGDGGLRPSLARASLRLAIAAIAIAAAGYFIKVSPAPKAVAVAEFSGKAILRTESGGFVREILCANGQRVAAGQVLAQLENLAKETELEQLRIDIQHSELRLRSYFEKERLSAYQAETELSRALQEKMERIRVQVDGLAVKAPFAGRVYGRRLESLPGRYLEPGKEVFTVVPDAGLRVVLLVLQKDVEELGRNLSGELSVWLRGHSQPVRAKLERIESRATTALPHPALSASAGGPLMVRLRPQLISLRETGLAHEIGGAASDLAHFASLGESAPNQELTEARFAAYATLTQESLRSVDQLREGEWGYAKLRHAGEKRLFAWLSEKVTLYVQEQLERARR